MSTRNLRTGRSLGLRVAAVAVASGIVLSACGSGTVSSEDRDSERATQLANDFNQRLAAAGLPPVDTETATSLYGVDGGVSCENVGGLQQDLGLAQFGNNALNLRRVPLDSGVVAYDYAVVETYCPGELGELDDELADLDTEDTVPTPSND